MKFSAKEKYFLEKSDREYFWDKRKKSWTFAKPPNFYYYDPGNFDYLAKFLEDWNYLNTAEHIVKRKSLNRRKFCALIKKAP